MANPSGTPARGLSSPTHTYARGAACPSCERFIGPCDVCPFCEADSARSPVLRHLCRWVPPAALALLGLLYLLCVCREVPPVAICEIRPAMNFGVVRLCGTVAQGTRRLKSRGGESLQLRLDDGTGRVRVILSPFTSAGLRRAGRVPAKGDRLEISGALQCRMSGEPVLQVQSARQVRRADPGADRLAPGAADSPNTEGGL